MDERLKILLIWGAFIALVIGLRLLVDYVLIIYPLPQAVPVIVGGGLDNITTVQP